MKILSVNFFPSNREHWFVKKKLNRSTFVLKSVSQTNLYDVVMILLVSPVIQKILSKDQHVFEYLSTVRKYLPILE